MKSEKEIRELLALKPFEKITTELRIGGISKYPSGAFRGYFPRNGQEISSIKKTLKWVLE